MSKKVKAFIFNLIGFAIIFIALRYFLLDYTNLTGIWKPVTAFVVATILAPKFQAIQTNEGEKLFVGVMFMKGIREIK